MARVKKSKEKLPTKSTMNFVHNDVAKNNRRALIFFGIFLVFLVIFVQIGVIMPLQRMQEEEAQYTAMASNLRALQEANSNYNEVNERYNEIVGSYLTEQEKASLDRPEILQMIEEDIMPYVGVKSISVSGSDIVVVTVETDFDNISYILGRLKADESNAYATVSTNNYDNPDSTLVNGTFRITFATSMTENQSTVREVQ